MPLQIRRGTELQRQAMTVPLAAGELLYVTDDQRLYVGNGITLGGVQITGYTNEDAVDAVSAALVAGTHNGITFTYGTAQDIANRIDVTVDLSNYDGTIKAPAFQGSIFDDNSTLIINSFNGSVNLDGTVKGDIVPDADITYDIGSPSNRFRDLYLSGSSIRLGNATITSVGSAVNLPAGSTINGEPLSAANLLTELNANVIADDSTVIVNTSTKVVTAGGGFVGNVTGNITGNIFTNLIDSADSSTITFTPAVVFNSDLTVDNELFSKNINVVGTITVGDNTEKIRMLGRADGPVIQSLNEELVLESAANIGPQVRVNVKSSATTGGSILTGVASSQQFDIRSYKNGATAGDPGDIASGDVLGAISFTGIMNSTLSQIACAMGVQADPNGTLTSTHIPSKFFFLANSNVPAGGFKFMTFDSQGRLAVNQETASATLDINGFAKLAILNAAPSGPANGMVAIANGTGWDPLSMPGKQQMVAYLGGAWRQMAVEP